jgi:phenylpropionate dioxygenase-like ring-hydroxylating dioxygenase large terminal subunit
MNELSASLKDFIPGESSLLPLGNPTAQERKSAPLSSFVPNREQYTQINPKSYFDPTVVDREWKKLWTKVWMCAGRVSDLPEKGSWSRFDFGKESFILSRVGPDEIVALYNVCQHRANRLIDEDFGKSNAFICPFHSWRYDRSGKNVGVTDRETFSETALCGDLNLRMVKLETYGGFIFINMDDKAGPLSDYLGEIVDITSGYLLDAMEVRADIRLELACNWKIIQDAFSENYHVHITHPAFVDCTLDRYLQIDFYKGGHSRRITPVGPLSTRKPKTDTLNAMQKYLLQSAGIDPDEFSGNPEQVRRAIQIVKRAKEGIYSKAYSKLSDNQLSDNWAMNIFPNMHWSMHSEGLLMLRYEPHPTDPEKCYLYAMVLALPGMEFELYCPVKSDANREYSGRPSRVYARHDDTDVEEVVGRLIYEDIRNTRESQQGMKSAGFTALRLSEQEQVIMLQHAEIDRYLHNER